MRFHPYLNDIYLKIRLVGNVLTFDFCLSINTTFFIVRLHERCYGEIKTLLQKHLAFPWMSRAKPSCSYARSMTESEVTCKVDSRM